MSNIGGSCSQVSVIIDLIIKTTTSIFDVLKENSGLIVENIQNICASVRG